MPNISFAEEKRVAIEFESGQRLTFTKHSGVRHPHGVQYKMTFVGDGSNLAQSYLNLPSIEDMLGFLASVRLELPAEELQSIRVQLSQ